MAPSIIDLCDQLAEANTTEFGDSFRPVLNPPATPQEISDLEAHWGHSLPESYRDLLCFSNGLSGLIGDISFFSVGELIEDNDAREFWEEFVPELAPFWVAWGPTSGTALFLDPATLQDGEEMEVVEVDQDVRETRYPSLRDYFEAALASRQSGISKKTRLN